MKSLSSHIVQLTSVALASAIAASVLTVWLDDSRPLAQPTETTLSFSESQSVYRTGESQLAATLNTTSTASIPTTSQKPSPTPTPTTVPVPTPTPAVHPDLIGDDAAEQLAMLTDGRLVQALFKNIEPSVVGIRVEAKPSDSTTLLTDSGTGVIYRDSGLILTSADLMSIGMNRYGELLESTEILVRVAGRVDPFPAEFIGKDSLTGVAVLKIEPGYFKLQPAVFATESKLAVGQHVFACSFPDDLIASGCLTAGLINALHQPIRLEDGTNVEMIRSDTPILEGGNGGPLINLAGEVIALSITSELTDTYDSLSYALPSEAVLSVADSLIDSGFVSGRAWLGVAVLKDESFDELQALYRFPDGLYVSHVIADSPAYIADIRRGDIITAVNEVTVDKHQSLSSILAKHEAGDQLVVEVYRRADGKYHELKVYLKAYES